MKNRKEIFILGALYILFGCFTLSDDARTNIYIFYKVASFLGIGLLFFGHVFYLYPRFLLRKKIAYYLLTFLLLFALLYLLTSFLFAYYFKVLVEANHDINFPVVKQMFYPPVLTEVLMNLGIAACLGLVYAFIRKLVKEKRYARLKKIALYTSLTIAGLIVVATGKYYLDIHWKGNETTHFMSDQEMQSLEDLIRQEQFKNKVVYIDLWFTTCGPCMMEFQRLPEVKAQLKDKPVAYLYLAHETSLPNDRQRWKNTIRKFRLNGWHIYMSPQLESNVWGVIEKNTSIKNRYPHYLLIDQQGKVVSYNAHRPNEKEKIVSEIEELLD